MSYKKILDSTLTAIANAIRGKTGGSSPIQVSDMAQEIASIPAGGYDIIGDIMPNSSTTPANVEYRSNYAGQMDFSPFGSSQGINNYWLKSVSIPNVTMFPQNAFYSCKNLISADVSGATQISKNCFSGCNKLETVDIGACGYIGNYSFYWCSSLQNIAMQAGTRGLSIGQYAMSNCTSLKEFITRGYGSVGTSAFGSCSALELFDFGYGSEGLSIAMSAFSGCQALKAVVLRKTNAAASLSSTSAFTNTPIESGTGYIYVPRDLISAYEAATNWNTYAGQFRAIEDYTDDGTLDGDFVMPTA